MYVQIFFCVLVSLAQHIGEQIENRVFVIRFGEGHKYLLLIVAVFLFFQTSQTLDLSSINNLALEERYS